MRNTGSCWRPVTEAVLREARLLRAEGMTYQAIAMRFGVSMISLRYRLVAASRGGPDIESASPAVPRDS